MSSKITEKYTVPSSFLDTVSFRKTAVSGSAEKERTFFPDLSDDDRHFLLLQAGMIGDIKAIEALVVDEQTDINWQDPRTGKTVAFNLVISGHGGYLPNLKEMGADLNILDFNGRNITFDIVLFGSLRDLILADKLDVSLHLTDNLGFNLFHILSVAKKPLFNIGTYLYDKGVDLTAKSKEGLSPITLDIALNTDRDLFDFYISLLE